MRDWRGIFERNRNIFRDLNDNYGFIMIILDDVAFLAANTPRSNSYAQTMAQNNIKVQHTIVYGDPQQIGPQNKISRDRNASLIDCDICLPDLSQPVAKSMHNISVDIEQINVNNVNNKRVVRAVSDALNHGISLVIYSGFGGQIVGSAHLNLGVPYLHAHSGWLPEYRGSTTIYYSLINNASCGVSIIKLASGLDRGAIIERRNYPPPSAGIDIDLVYDSAIRADLMAYTLKKWSDDQGIFGGTVQNLEERGTDYFVIHPVLKHLAIHATRPGLTDSSSLDLST